ncbi:PII uridylyl-transferase [Aeromonas hydrophila]|uniref:nucleoside-diphosphate sugar epimerase/dehydratase n=1 Tax=Aeromonas hydrophila TaxID=644 RepID=UPI0015DC6212|nr:nucleoside-diphosphate sugar epimerase/dehydratase [Aeromonas hydrophila]BBT05958.1 PII uridylyl-transferase [Aeromonas hydrophila]
MHSILIGLSRKNKVLLSVVTDVVWLAVAYWSAYWVRLDSGTPFLSWAHWLVLIILCPLTVLLFVRIGLYRAILRYVGLKFIWTIALGALVSSIFLVMLSYFFEAFIPRTVSLIYFSFSIILIGGSRLGFKFLLQQNGVIRTPIIIYGAGSSGRQLQLALNQGREYCPVAFVDDDVSLKNTTIQGIRVYSPDDIHELVEKFEVEKILLAIPSASRTSRQGIIRRLENLSCEVLSIPGTADLVNGKAHIDELNEVSIDDLLCRDPVEPIAELITANITGKRVMVTGAGGSIGSELCRQIILCKPAILVLFDVSEYSLYAIDKEIKEICQTENISIDIIPLLGSVQRQRRLKAAMKSFSIQTVYHAAAYKHVPLVEYNVVEGVRNNVFGTLYAAQAAITTGVETFVLISTDKAVRPTNTMGTTKRLAELILQALASEQSNTRFCMVRFGNVLGSSGSVVPLFRKQLRSSGPLTVTHPDIIRYFMTIPEASQLVIQAGAMGTGGDVFVLDMGQPVKIIDLAHRMIKLSGLTLKNEQNPNGDIEIEITGLRPGEKLYEELLIGEQVHGTAHPRIMKATEKMLPWSELRESLIELDLACHDFNQEKIRNLLLTMPTGFSPTDGICDLVWQAQVQTEEKVSSAPLAQKDIYFIHADGLNL